MFLGNYHTAGVSQMSDKCNINLTGYREKASFLLILIRTRLENSFTSRNLKNQTELTLQQIAADTS